MKTCLILLLFSVIWWGCGSTISREPKHDESAVKLVKGVGYCEVKKVPSIFAIWEEELKTAHILSSGMDFLVSNAERIAKFDFNKDSLEADIYYIDDGNSGKPLIIFITGGGFVMGNRWDDAAKVFCNAFARRGYVCASIDYRKMNYLTPSFVKAGYIATQDALNAFRYFYKNADKYQIDPDKIVFAGVSAGAVTALNAAFLGNDEKILDREGKLDEMYGVLRQDFPDAKPAAVVNIAGAVFDLNILNDDIPTISFHGTNDEIISHKVNEPFDGFSTSFNKNISKVKSYFSSFSDEVQEFQFL